MMANFKKVGVAAAVAAALGGAGVAQASVLGAPGDALLIPYVFAGTNARGVVTNTLIGVTVADPVHGSDQFVDLSAVDPAHPAGVGTLSPLASKYSGALFSSTPYCNASAPNAASIHWYFFDKDSHERASGVVPVTCEDFVRLDWNFLVTGNGTSASPGFPDLENVPGYLVITDNTSGGKTRPSGLVLFGAAYQIRGNWNTQAFIPAVPLVDRPDGFAGDEVDYTQFTVGGINPVSGGMLLPHSSSTEARFSLRYVADTTSTDLPSSTTWVIWFPDTGYVTRSNVGILVYNTEEVPFDTAIKLPHELNLIEVDPTADPAKPKAPHTGVFTAALRHTEQDRSGVTAVGPAVNTGFVLFNVSDYHSDTKQAVVDGNSVIDLPSSLTPGENSRGGFAFSLIGIGAGNAVQVQTELAHERGLYDYSPAP